MLRGSVSAPKSARQSSSFGILAAATDGEVRRWIGILERSGALVEHTTPDGYRVVEKGRAEPPRIPVGTTNAEVDGELFERLRNWRSERARTDSVPAYVVFPDATLREIAALEPQALADLAGIKGVGPTKLERYGEDVIAVVASS